MGCAIFDLDRLAESFELIDFGSVEREATPKPAKKLGNRLHAAGLSLSDSVSVLDGFGIDRRRTTDQK